MKIIGITGYKGSGKTSLGRVLNEYGAGSVSFSRHVWQGVHSIATAIGEPVSVMADSIYLTLRQNYGPNVHVDAWRKCIEPMMNQEGFLVVDDVRFLNEANAIHDLGGVIIRMFRPESDMDPERGNPGPLEEQVDKIVPDYSCWNTGDQADLHEWVATTFAPALGMTKSVSALGLSDLVQNARSMQQVILQQQLGQASNQAIWQQASSINTTPIGAGYEQAGTYLGNSASQMDIYNAYNASNTTNTILMQDHQGVCASPRTPPSTALRAALNKLRP